MSKKLMSIILALVFVVSVAVVGLVSVTAAVDSNERYVPSEGTKTNRLYFAMPESWKSAKFGADTAGAYWWGGTDACGSLDGASVGNAWPGYKIQVADADANLFFVDLPDDVPVVIFNNFLNGGERKTDEDGNVTYEFGEEQFKAAKQTLDVPCQYVSDGDDDLYDNLLDGDFWSQAEETLNSSDKTFFGNFANNFFMDPDFDTISFSYDHMVYVVDPTNVDVNAVSGKETYGGNFYFFYAPNEETGKYEYGELPNYDMAKENGLVKEIGKNATPDQPVKPDDPAKSNVINFDVKKSGWNNVKTVFCHIWRADGTGEWPAWQSKKEKCKYDSSTGIATYDLSLTGNTFSPSDGKVYCVIFSANTGMQTYNAIMSGKCIGDTLYCTGNQIENPEDSEKKALEAQWENNKDCGAERKITSTGNVVGTAFPDGETDVTMMATYLIAYYNDPAKTDLTQNLINTLEVRPADVMDAVIDKLNATDNPDKDTIVAVVEEILSGCTDPVIPDPATPDEPAEPENPDATSSTTYTEATSVTETTSEAVTETASKPTASTNPTSATKAVSTSDTANNPGTGSSSANNGAVQTGQCAASIAVLFIVLVLLAGAAGFSYYKRSKN